MPETGIPCIWLKRSILKAGTKGADSIKKRGQKNDF